jgi:hypothetical protein
MSALGHKRKCAAHSLMSALPPKADVCGASADVCQGPKADISRLPCSDTNERQRWNKLRLSSVCLSVAQAKLERWGGLYEQYYLFGRTGCRRCGRPFVLRVALICALENNAQPNDVFTRLIWILGFWGGPFNQEPRTNCVVVFNNKGDNLWVEEFFSGCSAFRSRLSSYSCSSGISSCQDN